MKIHLERRPCFLLVAAWGMLAATAGLAAVTVELSQDSTPYNKLLLALPKRDLRLG